MGAAAWAALSLLVAGVPSALAMILLSSLSVAMSDVVRGRGGHGRALSVGVQERVVGGPAPGCHGGSATTWLLLLWIGGCLWPTS